MNFKSTQGKQGKGRERERERKKGKKSETKRRKEKAGELLFDLSLKYRVSENPDQAEQPPAAAAAAAS